MAFDKGLKSRIEDAWDLSAEGYSTRIVYKDLVSPGREKWTEAILSMVSGRTGKLKILDVGTGPGVFATILSVAGHDVTGIDISEDMLVQARKNAEMSGVEPHFMKMDSDDLQFPDGSFDLIVSRNVMWIMPDPMKVYSEWFRVLKQGGTVVMFDGAHPSRGTDYDPQKEFEEGNRAYLEKNGVLPAMSFDVEDYEKARGFKRDLPLTYVSRPEWDVDAVLSMGFTDVVVDDVDDLVDYDGKDRGSSAYHLFRLYAVKR